MRTGNINDYVVDFSKSLIDRSGVPAASFSITGPSIITCTKNAFDKIKINDLDLVDIDAKLIERQYTVDGSGTANNRYVLYLNAGDNVQIGSTGTSEYWSLIYLKPISEES